MFCTHLTKSYNSVVLSFYGVKFNIIVVILFYVVVQLTLSTTDHSFIVLTNSVLCMYYYILMVLTFILINKYHYLSQLNIHNYYKYNFIMVILT